LTRKPWLVEKAIASVLIFFIVFTTSAVFYPVNAASLSSSYEILKNDPANQPFIQKILENGATEDQLKSFLDDLDGEVAKAGTITEANFDSIMYNALKEVLTWRNNRAILQALMLGFSEEIDYTLANHILHPNLVPLLNAFKDKIRGGGSGSTGTGGGGETEDDEISQEIDRQLALSGDSVSLEFDPISGKILIPSGTLKKIMESGREMETIS